MAENSETLCRAVASCIQEQLSIAAEYVNGIPWQERERQFDRGEIHILWLCGLPYVYKADMAGGDVELLAAPVPGGERYQGAPVYFSDVIVRRHGRFEAFADLRGASWVYNEPRSHSGFNVVRAHLADLGVHEGFFGEVIESGAHSASLQAILSDRADGAAIDSTVLEWLIAQRPEIAREIRVIATLGPSPIPPWVASTFLPAALRDKLRALLLGLHREALGKPMLRRAGFECFVEADERDYDPIRIMASKAESVSL
jgi:phosphonate transport system substrate-binding protein